MPAPLQNGTVIAMRDVDVPGLAEPQPDTTSMLPGRVAHSARTDIVCPPTGPVKILFFSANVKDGNQLALDEEFRAIEQRIRLARHRDDFQPISKPAARRSDLLDALLEHSPHVVHFACHGSSQAEIILHSDGPASDPVSMESLASLFSVLHDNLVLVVFNACFASTQASVIRQSAKVAIGMRSDIEDRAAIAFASALYGALAYGRSVQDAFTLGVAALDAHQRELPELFVRSGVDASKVYLVKPRRSRVLRIAFAAVVCCAALATSGRWLWRDPGPGIDHPLPVRGMVRFAATDVRSGVFDTARRPTSCSVLGEAEDCAELAHPEGVTSTQIAAFELDVMEVTNRELTDWLNASSPLWTTDRWGRILLRQGGVPLALVSEDCFGALAITEGNRVVVSPDKARWPVVCVTWQGAAEYCRGQHKRLPLAAEWELAAGGPGGRAFPWGTALPTQDGVAFELRDGAAPHPRDVGSSPQDVSPEGVHDLGGNVAEWVEDGRGATDTKTIRGGSWGSRGPCHLLASGCKRIAAGTYSSDVGFRCASSVIDGN
jgi:formylglycine-generating enzyme required for sulfatase activity